MYISYGVQLALILLAGGVATKCTYKAGRRTKSGLRARKQLRRVAMFFTEFYKAQISFAIANNIAAYVITKQGGFDADNLRELRNNYQFLVAANSFTSLLLFISLMILYRLRKQSSWFFSGLFYLIVYTSTYFFSFASNKMTAKDLAALKESFPGGPVECGGYSPWTWCDGNDRDVIAVGWLQLNRVTMLLITTMAIMGELIGRGYAGSFKALMNIAIRAIRLLEYLLGYDRNEPIRMAPINWVGGPCDSKQSGEYLALLASKADKWLSGFPGLPLIFALGLMCMFSISGTLAAYFIAAGLITHEWNFGQSFAVLIWLAPLSEWLNVELREMKKGLQSRIIEPYKLTSHDDGSQHSRESSSDGERESVNEISSRNLIVEGGSGRSNVPRFVVHPKGTIIVSPTMMSQQIQELNNY